MFTNHIHLPMITRKTALLFAILNSLYVIYFILLMIWLKQPLITDFSQQPVRLPNQVLAIIQIVMSVLSMLVFIGLAWVLRAYRETMVAVISLWLYLLLQAYLNTQSVFNILLKPMHNIFYNATGYINYALLMFMIVSIQFVYTKAIKGYYRWFGIIVLLSIIIVRLGPLLYEKYGLKWALINPGLLKLIPFLVTLLLFVKLFKVGKTRI